MTDDLSKFERELMKASLAAELDAFEQYAGPIPSAWKDYMRYTLEQRRRIHNGRTAALRLILAARDSGYELTTVYSSNDTQEWCRDRDGIALGPAIDAMLEHEETNTRFQMPGSNHHFFTVRFAALNGDDLGRHPVDRYGDCYPEWHSKLDLSTTVYRIINAAAGRA